MDFVLALLPWSLLWKLQMNKREKVGIVVAMSMGIMSVTPKPLLSLLPAIH
jgi:hypothetical protein